MDDRVVTTDDVIKKFMPGMSIYLGSGLAEPRTMARSIMASKANNLQDITLVQLASFSDAIPQETLCSKNFRLQTFFSGAITAEAITAGHVDLIPSCFSRIPQLIKSGQIPIDVALVQITPPNQDGYVSLGMSTDVARQAMGQASLVVGEINDNVPFTVGNTFVPFSDFDMIVNSTEPLFFSDRWPVDDVFESVAANVASAIDDGDCIGFFLGPFYEALGRHLAHKRHLGIHSPFFTDPLMDLIQAGAVTNRCKRVFRGRSLAFYPFGTSKLMTWLDHNPLVEFQGIDKVFNPVQIGRNPHFVAVLPARKIDLSGRVVLHFGKKNLATGHGEALDFCSGAELSEGGRTIFALSSRNKNNESNIRISVNEFPNQFGFRERVDIVATEYGVANLRGRTIRERAQAIIDIAHPSDRLELMEQAKAQHILYPDQLFIKESAHLYPHEIATKHTFKNDLVVRFRAIKPSDEEAMRRLFYRSSPESVYHRYLGPIRTMPHCKMQGYVNVDYRNTMSIIGLAGDCVVAEGRFVKDPNSYFGELAFFVDEQCQGHGIATYLYKMLIRAAKKQGIIGFTADVMASNKAMMRVFQKGQLSVEACLDSGTYRLTIPFDDPHSCAETNIRYKYVNPRFGE